MTNYNFSTKKNINNLLFILLFTNFFLPILISFNSVTLKLSLSILIFFYIYVFVLLIFNFKNNFEHIYFIFFFIIYWLFAFIPSINAHDDLSSYLVFAEKLIDTGSLPEEIFSVRRSYNLGGSYLFKGVISKFNPDFLLMFEPILGIILISILIFSTEISNINKFICFSVLMLSPFFGSKISLNTEPVFLMSFFSLSILLLIKNFKKNQENIPYWSPVILLFLPLLYRPTTFLFNSLLLLIFTYTVYKFFNKKFYGLVLFVFKKFNLFIYLFISIIFYPFLISSLKSSGTLIYPILGKGWQNEKEIFSDFPLNYYNSIDTFNELLIFLNKFFTDNYLILPIIIFSLILYIRENNRIYLFLLFSYLINCIAISLSIGVDWVFRYSFPTSLAILIYYIISLDIKFSINKKLLHAVYILQVIFAVFIYFSLGENINKKRYASMSLGYSDEIIKQMKNLKTIDSTDKILTHSIFSLALYKAGYKNIIIYDTPLVMQPWLNENRPVINNYEYFEDQFVKYYNKIKIDYFLSDRLFYSNEDVVDKLLKNNFELKSKTKVNSLNKKELNLYIYKLNK